jgi:EAL domain-containing protein (putative c-di-GMP-specific phosphodiesterase class I)
MRTGKIVGAEALIRWQHPQRGLLLPKEFLPIIENHKVSLKLGEWVINRALDQMVKWKSEGLDIPVSVNIDAFQLRQIDFVEKLALAIKEHPMSNSSPLQLEILETSALGEMADVLTTIEACLDLGVSFSLDDFGTGFSSLTYLKKLPAELLKIDQSFVRDMLIDPDDRAIVLGVIGLAFAFNRQVIAEGVETIDHGTQLLSMGCELAQGYGIARPMPAKKFPAWVADWEPDIAWTH